MYIRLQRVYKGYKRMGPAYSTESGSEPRASEEVEQRRDGDEKGLLGEKEMWKKGVRRGLGKGRAGALVCRRQKRPYFCCPQLSPQSCPTSPFLPLFPSSPPRNSDSTRPSSPHPPAYPPPHPSAQPRPNTHTHTHTRSSNSSNSSNTYSNTYSLLPPAPHRRCRHRCACFLPGRKGRRGRR